MTRILIVEGNTSDLTARRRVSGLKGVAEAYGDALRRFAPGIKIEIARPYFEGWSGDAIEMTGFDGMAVTGSGVEWSAADKRAEPFWRLYEQAFAASVPVLGCCWGLQNGAVVLGGDTTAGPNGVELGFARDLTLTEAGRKHPLHAGRTSVFDALCIHRDDVTRVPKGAVITASNAHTTVQGMVYEVGDISFWGVQYHPEMDLYDVAYCFRRPSLAHTDPEGSLVETAARLEEIAKTPDTTISVQESLGIGPDILDAQVHGLELKNWLSTAVGANLITESEAVTA